MSESDHDRMVRVEQQLARLREVVELRAKMTDDALADYKHVVDSRLERLNEFRGALADAQSHFVTRDVQEANTADLVRRIERNRDEYREAHEPLVARVDALAQSQASASGTAAGTMRIFMVAAVALSLLSVIVAVVRLVN